MMKPQQYKPCSETAKHDDNSAITTPTKTAKMPVMTQLQTRTTGPPYSRAWLESPATCTLEGLLLAAM